MKKVLVLSLFAMFAMMSYQAEAQTDACGFTYAQGYETGKWLGSSETFPGENYLLYQRTVNDFSHCFYYKVGVMEGYEMHRKKTGIYIDGNSGSCADGTIFTSDPCPKNDIVGAPEQ